MNTPMKKNTVYKDTFAGPNYEPSVPELGKDWPPPDAKQPQKNADAPQEGDNLLNERPRPELQNEKRHDNVGGQRQMQSDLRYTSVMKKKENVGTKEAQQKIASVAERAGNVLLQIKSVFPYDPFPNTVTIDSNKVTIVDKTFFASETVTNILLEEITDVVVESNFFLGKLKITYSHHPLRPKIYGVAALKKKEALKAAQIIQGLLVLRISEGIDLSKLDPEEIIKQLSKIGKPHENLQTL